MRSRDGKGAKTNRWRDRTGRGGSRNGDRGVPPFEGESLLAVVDDRPSDVRSQSPPIAMSEPGLSPAQRRNLLCLRASLLLILATAALFPAPFQPPIDALWALLRSSTVYTVRPLPLPTLPCT